MTLPVKFAPNTKSFDGSNSLGVVVFLIVSFEASRRASSKAAGVKLKLRCHNRCARTFWTQGAAKLGSARERANCWIDFMVAYGFNGFVSPDPGTEEEPVQWQLEKQSEHAGSSGLRTKKV